MLRDVIRTIESHRFVWVCSCLLLAVTAGIAGRSRADTFTTLYTFSAVDSSFTNADGHEPRGALIQASDGNLYGTAAEGGSNTNGTIFKITPAGVFTILHSFTGGADGSRPNASLIQASDGNLYGTAQFSGANSQGTIFKITMGGTFTTLHSFSALDSSNHNKDGAQPIAGLIQASDGNLYGSASYGGSNTNGTIFKITPSGVFTTLYSFSDLDSNNLNMDGAHPVTTLTEATDGNLYGTAQYGGASGSGTIFKIMTAGTFTTLYTFSALNGTYPNLTNAEGGNPTGLIQASDGDLYGTAANGGANSQGTIFKITTGGAFTLLYTLANADGTGPVGHLLEASDGRLYGTAVKGGANGEGTIFKVTPAGVFTLLYTFSALSKPITGTNADGGYPLGALIEATNGLLYGTAEIGGANGSGTLFALDVGLGAPTLTSLNPGSTDAAGPAFTLILKGSGFNSNSLAQWTRGTNTTPLTTTFVSATQLKASVPASLIANSGKASITVLNGSSLSNSKSFTILLTSLKLLSAKVTKTGAGNYNVSCTLKNVGYQSASNLKIAKSSLGAATTSTTLPVSLGNLGAGATATTTLSYSGTAGSSGTVVVLKVTAAFTGGSFNGSLKVTLP